MPEEGTNNRVESDKIEHEDDDKEAHSIERITITKGPSKISSRYLSGPRSSCHDLCKFCHQHAVTEAKPWKTKKKVSTSTRDSKTKVQEENVASSAVMKKSGIKSKPHTTSKAGDLKSPVDTKEVIDEKKAYNSWKNSTPFEEKDVSNEHNGSYQRKEVHSELPSLPVKVSSKNQTKGKTVKSRSALGSSSIKETASCIKQTSKSLIVNKEKTVPKSRTLSSKHNVKKTSSLRANKDSTIVSSLKDHENDEEAIKEKNLHVTEPTSTNLSKEPIPPSDESRLSSTSSSPPRNKSLKQTSQNSGNSRVFASTRKGLRHAGHSSGSVSPLSFVRKGKKPIIVSRSPSISSSSSISSYGKQNGSSTSRSTSTGNSSPDERVKMGGYKVKRRKSTIVGSENKVTPPRKLTFRRGNVIEIQPQINNIIRRLNFTPRPTYPLGDDFQRDINGVRRRAIASKEDDSNESSVASSKQDKAIPRCQIGEGGKTRIIVGRKVGRDRSKSDASRPGSDEEVVLNHQDAVVEKNKVNPRLYNNVIEETANMLSELRKSKVKALVGAFETVISRDSL